MESERYYTENLNSSSGQLTSPEYPCNYPNNVNYTWTIQTGNDYVNFTILELDAEVRTHGEWFCVDYLKVINLINLNMQFWNVISRSDFVWGFYGVFKNLFAFSFSVDRYMSEILPTRRK